MEKKKLTFKLLLKVETALSFFLALFFLSFNITGFAVAESAAQAGKMGLFFLGLGALGAITLLYSRSKAG